MIYTAPYVMLLMRAQINYEGKSEGLGPGNRDFLGPVKCHRGSRSSFLSESVHELSKAAEVVALYVSLHILSK